MEVSAYENGAPCWLDLMTTDRQQAIAFYTGLFGWTEGDAGPTSITTPSSRSAGRRWLRWST
jgi:predicted enzyme related to lactoylglutathione lyase